MQSEPWLANSPRVAVPARHAEDDAGLPLRATAGAWANTPTLVDRRGFEPRGTKG